MNFVEDVVSFVLIGGWPRLHRFIASISAFECIGRRSPPLRTQRRYRVIIIIIILFFKFFFLLLFSSFLLLLLLLLLQLLFVPFLIIILENGAVHYHYSKAVFEAIQLTCLIVVPIRSVAAVANCDLNIVRPGRESPRILKRILPIGASVCQMNPGRRSEEKDRNRNEGGSGIQPEFRGDNPQ